MNLIRSNYLEQMTEELEIINYHLDRIYREAASRADTTPVTLLESEDASCFAEYAKAIDEVNSRICNAASYFVESVFSNSGEKFTPDEARSIIKTVSEGNPDGINKLILRKALYLIAGLSKTINATEITRAIKSGATLDYVMKSIVNVNATDVPNSNFRVCIGIYDDQQLSFDLIKSILSQQSKMESQLNESVMMESVKKRKELIQLWDELISIRFHKSEYVNIRHHIEMIKSCISKIKDLISDASKNVSPNVHQSILDYLGLNVVIGGNITKDEVHLVKEVVDLVYLALTNIEHNIEKKFSGSNSIARCIPKRVEDIRQAINNVTNHYRSIPKENEHIRHPMVKLGQVYRQLTLGRLSMFTANSDVAKNPLVLAIFRIMDDMTSEIELFSKNASTKIRCRNTQDISTLKKHIQNEIQSLSNAEVDAKIEDKKTISLMAQNVNKFFAGLTDNKK